MHSVGFRQSTIFLLWDTRWRYHVLMRSQIKKPSLSSILEGIASIVQVPGFTPEARIPLRRDAMIDLERLRGDFLTISGDFNVSFEKETQGHVKK